MQHVRNYRRLRDDPGGREIREMNSASFVKACGQGDIARARELCSPWMDVNYRDPDTRRTALEEAVRQGDAEMVKFLVQVRVNVEECSEENGECTPLMIAATLNFVEIAKILVKANASVAALNNRQCTVFHKHQLSLEMAMLLCPVGAAAQGIINQKNVNGCNPLMRAVTANHLEQAMFYASVGSDLRARNHRDWTAMELAQDRGFDAIAHCLHAVQGNGDYFPELEQAKAKCVLVAYQQDYQQDWLAHVDALLELLEHRKDSPSQYLLIYTELICQCIRTDLDPLDAVRNLDLKLR